MIKIRSLRVLRAMPDGVVKMVMEAKAILCHDNDAEMLKEMEEEFNGPLGGDWYLFEKGDDPQNFAFDEGYPTDLLSNEWNWCDSATLENGCFFIFWGTNNAGGPCLFVPDEPWLPMEFRTRLVELVVRDDIRAGQLHDKGSAYDI